MSNVVYSGQGTYNATNLTAVYNVYLPKLTKGTYKFHTEKIYNFSCTAYPNTILLFMEVAGDTNVSLSGLTNEPAVPVMFSLLPTFVADINAGCKPLDTTQDIKVIIMHDDDLDTTYAMANYYNTWPAGDTSGAAGRENAIYKPKQIGIGRLVKL